MMYIFYLYPFPMTKFIFFLVFSLLLLLPVFAMDLFSQQVIDLVEQDISQRANPQLGRVIWANTFAAVATGQKVSKPVQETAKAVSTSFFASITAAMTGAYDKSFVHSFLVNYGTAIMTPEIPLPARCFSQYPLLDQMSRAMGIPTALTIAIWKMEADCKYGPYVNGPFQLMAYTYPTDQLHQSLFLKQLVDFGIFTHHKRAMYGRANAKQ